MGKLQQHRIENREPKKSQSHKSLIEEIPYSTKPVNSEAKLRDSRTAKASYVILREPAKGPTERLIALFDMPKSVSHKIIKIGIIPELYSLMIFSQMRYI